MTRAAALPHRLLPLQFLQHFSIEIAFFALGPDRPAAELDAICIVRAGEFGHASSRQQAHLGIRKSMHIPAARSPAARSNCRRTYRGILAVGA